MGKDVVLWDDVPEGQQTDRMPDGWRPEWRGCTAAVKWPTAQQFWRCSLPGRVTGFCRKHAEKVGLLPETPRSNFPRGLDNRIGNVIARHVQWRSPGMTVQEFRALSNVDLRTWRNAGRVALAAIREVQATWTDDELIQAFGFRSSSHDARGDFAVCNWVGEAAG